MVPETRIIDEILTCLPTTQAVYLFGSAVTGDLHEESDVDLAVLLPHDEAKRRGALNLSDLRYQLEDVIGRRVDLINLRRASTVLQHQVLVNGRVLFVADSRAHAEFEMISMSLYQKLNQERA
jgi:predicted nucleotidyltransferase